VGCREVKKFSPSTPGLRKRKMPELPEVETIVRNLRKLVSGRTITGVWTDLGPKIKVCLPGEKQKNFSSLIKGCQIKNIQRKGKWILISLSRGLTLLVHLRMTGHFLLGRWSYRKNRWQTEIPVPEMLETANSHLHLLFFLDNGKQLALSDIRKFAEVQLHFTASIFRCPVLTRLGPDVYPHLTFPDFQKRLHNCRGNIKSALLNQKVVAGLGNIYSDEILHASKIHPFTPVKNLSREKLRLLFRKMKETLSCAIASGGTSISDYRKLDGDRGNFQNCLKVYGRQANPCFRCGTFIQRKKFGSRSTYFCPVCQIFQG